MQSKNGMECTLRVARSRYASSPRANEQRGSLISIFGQVSVSKSVPVGDTTCGRSAQPVLSVLDLVECRSAVSVRAFPTRRPRLDGLSFDGVAEEGMKMRLAILQCAQCRKPVQAES